MDRFNSYSDNVTAPAMRAQAILPSDTVTLAEIPKALYIGTGGNLNLIAVGDTAIVAFRNIQPGTILPVRVAKVMQTGTTAADIVALS